MRNRVGVRVFAAAASLALLAGSLPTHAQGSGEAVVKVEFQFIVGDKTFPAGTYRASQAVAGVGGLTVSGIGGEFKTTVPVITRLARTRPSGREDKTTMVFDKVGETRYLSEVWIPGQDGYLLRGTAEEHQHAVVSVN